jgi:hypothetical protein
MTNNHEKIPVHRHRLPGVESYDVTSEELDQIEREASQVGLDFSFASITLTAFISFMIALLTVKIESSHTFMGFIGIEIATGFLTIYFAWRWLRGRGQRVSIISKIRERQVGPLGEEGKEIRPSELVELLPKEPEKPRSET